MDTAVHTYDLLVVAVGEGVHGAAVAFEGVELGMRCQQHPPRLPIQCRCAAAAGATLRGEFDALRYQRLLQRRDPDGLFRLLRLRTDGVTEGCVGVLDGRGGVGLEGDLAFSPANRVYEESGLPGGDEDRQHR